jgi:hypothetical protein
LIARAFGSFETLSGRLKPARNDPNDLTPTAYNHARFTARLMRPDRQTGVGDLLEFICNEDNQYGAAGSFRPGGGAGNK